MSGLVDPEGRVRAQPVGRPLLRGGNGPEDGGGGRGHKPLRQLPGYRRGFKTRVVDPDPDWIPIQSGQWIRIRNSDPDPGGHKSRKKFKSSCFEVLNGLF